MAFTQSSGITNRVVSLKKTKLAFTRLETPSERVIKIPRPKRGILITLEVLLLAS